MPLFRWSPRRHCCWTASPLAAQEWPPYPSDQLPGRGPGGYLAWYKLLACWILVVFWVRAADWVNRDSVEVGDNIEMPSQIWNPIVVFTFLFAFLLAISIPTVRGRIHAAADRLRRSVDHLHPHAQQPRDARAAGA